MNARSCLKWALLLLCAVAPAPAGAFPDKNIEFVVGYPPGGGYSDWALAIAPFIQKHLPKKANVVVRHMPGAASVIATHYLHKAKPDGHIIGIYEMAGLAVTQLVREVQYDLRQVTWLAGIAVDNRIALVSAKGPYQSILDFKKQGKPEYLAATRGLSEINAILTAMTFARMGVKWKPLNHDGASKALLSVIRGDADINLSAYESVQQYIRNGDLRPLLYFDTQRHPDLPGVPIPAEVGMPEFGGLSSPRLLGAPPRLPPEVRKVLEEAIKRAVADPEFLAVVAKMKKTATYAGSREAEEAVRATFDAYRPYLGIVKRMVETDEKK
jgi:tripartite-type tricarboxylate transporter receptor subunit TctC